MIMLSLAVLALIARALPAQEEQMTLTTLQDTVGQMLVVGFRGYEVSHEVEEMLREVRPGGVVLFDYDLPSKGEAERNVESPEQVRNLTAELQKRTAIPLLIAVDAEGGHVNRLKQKYGFPVAVPSARKLGGGDVSETQRYAEELAESLRKAGINWNLAPVVDVNVDPASPAIGGMERSFSDDPERVAAHARAFMAGLKAHNIVPALKHFPGHGSASGDTHLGVTDVTETYQEDGELEPYRRLIGSGYADPIMTAHIVNRNLSEDGLPGTLSPAVISGLLRKELRFDGIIVSDDIQMGAIVEEHGLEEAAVRTIQAGVDMVLLANQVRDYDLQHVYRVRDAIVKAVEDNSIPKHRIHESAGRIMILKRRFGIAP